MGGSVAYNAPIVKEQIEVHQVQNPVLVERRVEVPYDVPVYQENIVKVPTPVHVDAPVVTHSQHVVDGGVLPAVHAGHVAHGAVGAYAAAPAAALLTELNNNLKTDCGSRDSFSAGVA